MQKSKKFISMPIVSLEEGQQVGTIRGMIINPYKREIAALMVDQKGWFKDHKIIPYTKVKSVGGDAVTIEKGSSVEKVTNLPEILKLIKEDFELIGTKVITETGSVLGYVDEFEIHPPTGEIKILEISGRFLDSLIKGRASLSMEFVRTIGKDVVIVQEQAAEALIKVDGGLQETFHNIKGTTSQLWETTVQKTKELSKNLKKEIEQEELSGEAVYQGKYDVPPVPAPEPQIAAPVDSTPTEIRLEALSAQEDLPEQEEKAPETK